MRIPGRLGLRPTITRLAIALGAAAVLPVQAAPAAPFRAEVVVHFDAKRVRVAKASGLADPFARRAVTADDPVRIASISKLIVALGVMRLVEDGVLDLDRDVSDDLGWPMRNPAFPDRAITLRHLLSHRSGLQDGGERYIIPLGETLRERLSDTALWDAAHPPGDYFRYANLNFPVIASVMERATGERFDRLMQRLVFAPLALDACFNWSGCSDAAIARAVVLTDETGAVRRDRLGGRRPDCLVVPSANGGCDLAAYVPGDNGALFSPQGGVRISMRGLARIGQLFLRGGDGFLRPETMVELVAAGMPITLATGTREDGFYCRFGLSVHHLANREAGCRDDPVGDGRHRYGHSGEAYGLYSGLWLDGRRGAAFFVTAVPAGAPRGRSAFTAVEEAALRR